MINKKLLKNENDFKYWTDRYSIAEFLLSSNEEEPKHYPCFIAYKTVELDSIRNIIYYDFIYLDDFKNINSSTK